MRALLVFALALGCASPVGVRRVSPREVHATLTANVLSTGEPSAPSSQVLQRHDLAQRFWSDPEAALADLHARLGATGNEDLVFALAELSFLHAERSGRRDHYLAAAAYAYAFLFPGDAGVPPGRFDPRERLAADLYNRALAAGLASADGASVVLEGAVFPMPFGELDVEVDPRGFAWSGFRLVRFVPAAEFAVRGMRNRYRRAGLGAPLVASTQPDPSASEELRKYIPPRLKIPVTAFLRIEDPRRSLAAGRLRGTLALYTPDRSSSVEVDGESVPLEYEPSSSLAYTLEGAAVWDFELAGFLSGDFRIFQQASRADGLFMLSPHRPGRVPVVLVHGTASSPGRWAELVNELTADPVIREHYQVWLFAYNTGNPIAYSASLLRQALARTVAELDPQGRDPALRQIVVIGHSQGGLLTKLTAVESGDRFWQHVSDVPLEQLDLAPETRELLGDALFVEPVPNVKTLVFIATPHRGSFLAGRRLGRLAASLVRLPLGLAGNLRDAIERNPERLALRSLEDVPSSVDNMDPSNRFIRTLAELPIAPGVDAHSIIAVEGDGPPEAGNDGVVEYQSAHLEGVPELVVRSGHSTQANPHTIAEVHRILLERVGQH